MRHPPPLRGFKQLFILFKMCDTRLATIPSSEAMSVRKRAANALVSHAIYVV